MHWALLSILLLSSPALAADRPVGKSCQDWFSGVGRSLAALPGDFKKSTVDLAKRAVAAEMQLEEDIIKEGPLRFFVRKRTEEEAAQGYRSYFVMPKEAPLENPGIFRRGIQALKNLNPLRRFTPTRGVILSADRLFLRNYTATNGFRGGTVLAGTLATGAAAINYTYEIPMEWLEKNIPHYRAVTEALDNEYEFRFLREKISKGEITEAQARKEVDETFKARAEYFKLFELFSAASSSKTLEEIGPKFAQFLNAKELGSTMKDLRYYLSSAFLKNKSFLWGPNGPPLMDPEKFGALFALNHIKLFGTLKVGEWIAPSFKAESLSTGPMREVYDEVMKDPFRAKLVAYQRAHTDKVSPKDLENWLSEDLEWSTRFAELETLGAKMRGKNPGQTLELGDRRAYFLEQNKIALP